MDLRAPFAGVLLLPDKEFLNPNSPVMLPDGQVIAGVGWHTWTQKFEVYDASGALIAECRPTGVFRKTYSVRTPDGRPVVDVRAGGWLPIAGSAITLSSGRQLTVRWKSVWSDRRFEFSSGEELVAQINPATGVFTFHPDSYAFEMLQPVMSPLEAISLAQVVRMMVRARRQQRNAAAST
jgi:hypothetical protein